MAYWKTKSGVVVIDGGRKTAADGSIRIAGYRALTGAWHGWLRKDQLKPAERPRGMKRAVRS